VLGTYLSKAGYEVDCVSNGRAALHSILMRAPDCLILDLSMPQMDGSTLLEVLRSYLRLRSLPVVVFTGVSDSPLAERARKMHVSTILTKCKASLEDVLTAVQTELPPPA
jgi:CheY-like chemotaxis protein